MEANHLLTASSADISVADRLRQTAWAAPVAAFVHTLLIKGCILDGWPGWVYALQRTLAEIMIALEILDRHLRSRAQ